MGRCNLLQWQFPGENSPAKRNGLCLWEIVIHVTLVCTEQVQTTIENQLQGMPGNPPCQLLFLLFFLRVQSTQVVRVNVWLNKEQWAILIYSYKGSSHCTVAVCYGSVPQRPFALIICHRPPSSACSLLPWPFFTSVLSSKNTHCTRPSWQNEFPLPPYFPLYLLIFPKSRAQGLQLWTWICPSHLPDGAGPCSTPLVFHVAPGPTPSTSLGNLLEMQILRP